MPGQGTKILPIARIEIKTVLEITAKLFELQGEQKDRGDPAGIQRHLHSVHNPEGKILKHGEREHQNPGRWNHLQQSPKLLGGDCGDARWI